MQPAQPVDNPRSPNVPEPRLLWDGQAKTLAFFSRRHDPDASGSYRARPRLKHGWKAPWGVGLSPQQVVPRQRVNCGDLLGAPAARQAAHGCSLLDGLRHILDAASDDTLLWCRSPDRPPFH